MIKNFNKKASNNSCSKQQAIDINNFTKSFYKTGLNDNLNYAYSGRNDPMVIERFNRSTLRLKSQLEKNNQNKIQNTYINRMKNGQMY